MAAAKTRLRDNITSSSPTFQVRIFSPILALSIIGVFPLRFRQRRLPVGCAARDRFLPLMGAPGRVPVQGLCMRKLSTHTARANSTILMHRLCRGFPTSHSRATVSSIYSRTLTAKAGKRSRVTYSSMSEPHKQQHCRVPLAKMVSADTLVAPSATVKATAPALQERRRAVFASGGGCPPASAHRAEVGLLPGRAGR